MHKRALAALRRTVSPDRFSHKLEDRILHSYDGTKQSSLPDVVIRPVSTEEVSAVLRVANDEGIPVYAVGAASGLTGGSVPTHGGIALDMTAMDRIIEIDRINSIATVEPGVVLERFQQEVEKLGLFYPPDPASSDVATMGGTVAECAGGLRGLKYGVTRDYVLALEVVLANGDIIQTGAKVFKSVAGYDLTRLMIGSEGTLGIITRITLKLIPLPETIRTVLAFFETPVAAAECAVEVCGAMLPRALEFIDEGTLKAVCKYTGTRIPRAARALLLVESDGLDDVTRKEQRLAVETCKRHGAVNVKTASAQADRDKLWRIRRSVSPALFTIAPNKLNHDICITRSDVPGMLAWLDRLAHSLTIPLVTFGHIGEGNLHVNLMYDHSRRQKAEAERATRKIFEKAVSLGGTLSGEHGIGNRKAKYLPLEIGEIEMSLMRRIKKLLDPRGILNPDKIFPVDETKRNP